VCDDEYINKKFWEELICLLSLHKLTADYIQCNHLHTKFHPNPPIGSKFAPTSEIKTYAILEWLKLRDLILWNHGRLQCHHLHTKFHLNPPNSSKIIKGFLYTHLRSLNVRHFGMAKATRLKMWLRGHLEWQYLPTKFHENPQICSKVISGGHADRQTHRQRDTRRQVGDFISPVSFFTVG
jgi:hypothetical protein